MAETSAAYQPRNPQASQYYQCVEDHSETLEQLYDDRFAKKYGFLRPYVNHVIYRYLDCGILHNGFVPAGNALGVHGSNVESVGMNFYWRFRASGVISARPVIRSGSWNSESGFVRMSSRQSPTGILSSAYLNFFADIFFTIENCFPVWVAAAGNP